MGEGGALLFQDEKYLEPAEILREKGTDRSKYFRGQVDKYTWVNYGSSYLPSDMNAAYLWAQLEEADKINQKRLKLWNYYHEHLADLEEQGWIQRPLVPEYATHNAMYLHKSKRSGHQNEASGISEGKRDFKCLSLCAAALLPGPVRCLDVSTGKMCIPRKRVNGCCGFRCIIA